MNGAHSFFWAAWPHWRWMRKGAFETRLVPVRDHWAANPGREKRTGYRSPVIGRESGCKSPKALIGRIPRKRRLTPSCRNLTALVFAWLHKRPDRAFVAVGEGPAAGTQCEPRAPPTNRFLWARDGLDGHLSQNIIRRDVMRRVMHPADLRGLFRPDHRLSSTGPWISATNSQRVAQRETNGWQNTSGILPNGAFDSGHAMGPARIRYQRSG